MKKNIDKVLQFLYKNKISLFAVALYVRFFKMCSIPLEKANNSKFIRKIGNYYKEHPRMDYVFLVGSIILVSLILFYRFIFGNEVFMFNELDFNKDQICNYYPYLNHIFHHKDGLSFWSFNSGMGNNMFPMINQFFLDPFNIINALFWNPMENGFVYMLILKLICLSIVFYKLVLIITESRYASFLTAFLFSFNGFIMFMGQHWGMVNKVFAFIFLLYSIEIYFKSKNKWWLILLAMTIMISDFYFFFQSIFFVGFYLLFRNLYFEGDFRKIPIQAFKLSIFTIIGGLLASVIILPIISVLNDGPRLSLNNFDFGKLIFSLNDLKYYVTLCGMYFSNNLSGHGLNFFGWNDFMRSPIVYSGLLSILLLPQFIYLKNKNHKKAILFISIISFSLVIFPFFPYLFNGFQELYFRWTYGIITFNLITTSIILKSILYDSTLNMRTLRFTVVFLVFILFLYWAFFSRHDGEWNFNEVRGLYYENKNSYIFGKGLILGLLIVIYFTLVRNIRKYKIIFGLLFIFTTGFELINEHYDTFYSRGLVKKENNPYKSEFAISNQNLLNRIKQKDKTPFYRIEQQYYQFGNILTRNNSLSMDYYGLKSYTSLNPKSTYDFCLFFNLVKKRHWPNILPSTEATIKRYRLLNILSIKYLLSKEKILDNAYSLVEKSKGVYVYENENFIPLGCSFDKYILKSKMETYPDEIKDSLVNSTLILEDKNINQLKTYFGNITPPVKMKINHFSNSLIKGCVFSSVKKMLYFSIPCEKGWEIRVNGKVTPYYNVNIGFIGLPIERGFSKIELKFTPPKLKLGIYLSLGTLLSCLLFYYFRSKRIRSKNIDLDKNKN
jgi:uncharacterized membrane protein YfhO